MQVHPADPETATCYPRTTSVTSAEPAEDVTEASSTLPCWTSLPTVRRSRLVAVLGSIVQRTRREGLDES